MSDEERDGNEPTSLVRHEEELRWGIQAVTAGSVQARKTVETEHVQRSEPRMVEHADFEHIPPADHDSGEIETLADGSISIPLFEERLVVTKQTFVRERVILRKRTVTEQHVIEAELRRERIDIQGDVEFDEPAGTPTGATEM